MLFVVFIIIFFCLETPCFFISWVHKTRDYFPATFPRPTEISGASTITINVIVVLALDILARFGNLTRKIIETITTLNQAVSLQFLLHVLSRIYSIFGLVELWPVYNNV